MSKHTLLFSAALVLLTAGGAQAIPTEFDLRGERRDATPFEGRLILKEQPGDPPTFKVSVSLGEETLSGIGELRGPGGEVLELSVDPLVLATDGLRAGNAAGAKAHISFEEGEEPSATAGVALPPSKLRLKLRLDGAMRLRFFAVDGSEVARAVGLADWELEVARLQVQVGRYERLLALGEEVEAELGPARAELAHALRLRDAIDRRQIESGDPLQTQQVVERLQARIQRLEGHLADDLPADDPLAVLLREDLEKSELTLFAATRARNESDWRAIESGDVGRTAEALERLQDRRQELAARLANPGPGDDEELLRQELVQTDAALAAARRERDAFDRQHIESGNLQQTQHAVERLQERQRDLLARIDAAGSDADTQLWRDDLEATEAALAEALTARDLLDEAQIGSGDPAQTESAVRRLLERRRDLMQRLEGAEPGTYLDSWRHDLEATEAALASAQRHRDAVDRVHLESGDPLLAQNTVARLQDRQLRLQRRLAALGEEEGAQAWRDELTATQAALVEARSARDAVDRAQMESGELSPTQDAVERLQARQARLRQALARARPEDDIQPWLDDLQHTDLVLSATRRSRDEIERDLIQLGAREDVEALVQTLRARRARLVRQIETLPPAQRRGSPWTADLSSTVHALRLAGERLSGP